LAHLSSDESLPNTLKEAYSGPDRELWKSALEEELQSLNSNHVYETVLILEGITLITSKPVEQSSPKGRVAPAAETAGTME